MLTTVTPTTDLRPFVGKRVRMTRTVAGTRFTYVGVPESLDHFTNPVTGGGPFCGGMVLMEPHHGTRGGNTGFDLPYGDATIELA